MNDCEILEQAAMEGTVTCENCGNLIEPDCEQCYCGWKNPIFGEYI